MAQANIKAVITAEDRASSTLKGFGSNVGGLGTKVASIAKGAALALGVATAAAITFGVKSASELQQARIAFETMLGSADEARKMMKRLSDFAVKTPFALPEVVQGAKGLLAYGIAADKILPTFKALGNIAAGVGKDKLPQLTLAFGQVRAAGKLTGQELRQFTEAGVPLLEILGKQAGKTAGQIKEDMENGAAPSFKEVEKAIFSMSGKGGKFFNLLEKQSKTLGGTLSNLKDVAIRTLSELVGVSVTGEIRKGSIFDILQRAANGLLTFLSDHEKEIFGFFNTLESTMKSVFGWIKTYAIPVIENMAQAFMQVWNIGMTLLKPVFDLLASVVKDVLIPAWNELWSKHGKELKQAFIILAGVAGGVLVYALMSLTFILGGLVLVITAVIKYFTFMANVGKTITKTFNNIGKSVSDARNNIRNFAADVLGVSNQFINRLASIFSNVFKLITNPFGAAFNFVINGINRIGRELGSLANKRQAATGKRSGGMVRARSGMQLTRVGEEGAENVMLPVGSQVQRNIDTKLGSEGGTVNINISGTFITNGVERRKFARELVRDIKDEAAKSGMSVAQLMGA